MISHVLPFLSDENDGDKMGMEGGGWNVESSPFSSSSTSSSSSSSGDDDANAARTYTHAEYVRGAEECLLIEDEIIRLEVDDPEYLDELEREALRDDPTIIAEIISNVLREDGMMLTNIVSKLKADAPDVVRDMENMLSEGEVLGDRPDVVAIIIARLLSDDQNIDLLDEFDDALSAAEWYGDGVREAEDDDGHIEDDGGGVNDEL
jgi:hypothetical protein